MTTAIDRINHVVNVICSCNTLQQLNNAYLWAVRVSKRHKLYWLNCGAINAIYRCKEANVKEERNDISS